MFTILVVEDDASLNKMNKIFTGLKPRPLGPSAYDIEVRKLPVQAGGHTLYGELLLPKDKSGPLPTVICCPGFGTSFRFCKKMVGMCPAMSGFAAYCFDFYGGCKGSKSGGTMLEISLLGLVGFRLNSAPNIDTAAISLPVAVHPKFQRWEICKIPVDKYRSQW